MTDHETSNTSLALLSFCRDLFDSNLTGTDFEDVSVQRVKRKFLQGLPSGLHIQFSVSWHAIGKTGKDAHDALDVLLPDDDDDD